MTLSKSALTVATGPPPVLKGKPASAVPTFLCLYFFKHFILKNVQLSEARGWGCQSQDVCFCPPLLRSQEQRRTGHRRSCHGRAQGARVRDGRAQGARVRDGRQRNAN